jgi:hypothetical protein
MTLSLFIGATLFATALAAGVPSLPDGLRGGGFGGFHGGGAWHAGAGGLMPGTLAASMASGAEPGTPMAGTPAAFMLAASTVQRSPIIITEGLLELWRCGHCRCSGGRLCGGLSRCRCSTWMPLPGRGGNQLLCLQRHLALLWQQWPLLSRGPPL